MTFISKNLQNRLPQQFGQKQPPENWQAAQHAAKLANQNDSAASAKQKQQAFAEDADNDTSDDNQNSYFDDADEDLDTDDDSEGGDENFSSGFDLTSKAFDLIAKRVKLWVIGAICPPVGIGAAAISAVLKETTNSSSSKDES